MSFVHITEGLKIMAVPENRLPTTGISQTAVSASFSFQNMQHMAKSVAASGMFGCKTEDQALTLMLLAQAEGVHPMTAVRDYHVFNGKPSLKAEIMLARFQRAGGHVKWHCYTKEKVEATFTPPAGAGDPVRIEWTLQMAKDAGLCGKDVWKFYSRSMLRSRTISEGVRAALPGVIAGFYTPEELQSIDPDLPESKEERINSFERPGMLQSIVDEWLQQIKECATEKDVRQVLSGALKEAKDKGDELRIGTFILAHDAQVELIREAAKTLKSEGEQQS